MTKAIDKEFKTALENGVFPSAELLVAPKGETLMHSYYGDAREQTCFDIASITKPFATATIAMMLVAEGLIKFEDTVYQWLAGAREPEHKLITVRNLLNHTSGLPAWQPYYQELPLSLIGTEAGKRLILESCYSEHLKAEPNKKTIYSDIGYIVLGEILEQAGDAPLDALFSQFVARPLGLEDTFYIRKVGAPSESPKKRSDVTAGKHIHVRESDSKNRKIVRRFAPTEDCPWRGRVIHGEVHDQNTYALGGVSGQAGLFSTASDIDIFCKKLFECYLGKSDWIPKSVIDQFIPEGKKKPLSEKYALGWCRPSVKNSSSGHKFSPNSIGHLGYTGCSVWIDLNREFHIILLSNRIYPSMTNERIQLFRPKIHDLIYRELIGK